MRYIPYGVGAFMLLPFFIWAGLWMAFPGPKPGITDSPLTFALLATSVPLVLFHYIAALGYIANSMAGEAGQELPVWGPARWAQRAMAPLTVVLSLAAAIWVYSAGEGVIGAAAVLSAGLFMAAVMAVARRPRRSGKVMAAPGKLVRAGVYAISRVAVRLPVIGTLWREAAANPDRAAPIIALNTVLLFTAIALIFGFEALVVPAMIGVPVVFFVMMALAAE
jgi:hypothetical protein